MFFFEVDNVVQCLQSKAPEEMLLWALVRLIVIVQRTFYSLFLKYLWSMWSIWRVLKMDGLDEGLLNSNEDSFIISNTNNFVCGLEYLSTSVFHQPLPHHLVQLSGFSVAANVDDFSQQPVLPEQPQVLSLSFPFKNSISFIHLLSSIFTDPIGFW